jgi:hypothetical protein
VGRVHNRNDAEENGADGESRHAAMLQIGKLTHANFFAEV